MFVDRIKQETNALNSIADCLVLEKKETIKVMDTKKRERQARERLQYLNNSNDEHTNISSGYVRL